MIRLLNILQGVISLVFVFFGTLLGWPIYVVIVGLIAPIAISLIIVIGLRETSPKGRTREAIEALIELFGLGVLTFWAISSNASLKSSPPQWMALVALLPVLFNLGIVVAWISWILGYIFGFIQEIFEYVSGETVRAK